MASSTGNIKQAYDVNGEKIYPKVILDAIEGEGGKTGMDIIKEAVGGIGMESLKGVSVEYDDIDGNHHLVFKSHYEESAGGYIKETIVGEGPLVIGNYSEENTYADDHVYVSKNLSILGDANTLEFAADANAVNSRNISGKIAHTNNSIQIINNNADGKLELFGGGEGATECVSISASSMNIPKDVSILKNLNVSGDTTVAATSGAKLSVGGDATFSNTITVNKKSRFKDDVSLEEQNASRGSSPKLSFTSYENKPNSNNRATGYIVEHYGTSNNTSLEMYDGTENNAHLSLSGSDKTFTVKVNSNNALILDGSNKVAKIQPYSSDEKSPSLVIDGLKKTTTLKSGNNTKLMLDDSNKRTTLYGDSNRYMELNGSNGEINLNATEDTNTYLKLYGNSSIDLQADENRYLYMPSNSTAVFLCADGDGNGDTYLELNGNTSQPYTKLSALSEMSLGMNDISGHLRLQANGGTYLEFDVSGNNKSVGLHANDNYYLQIDAISKKAKLQTDNSTYLELLGGINERKVHLYANDDTFLSMDGEDNTNRTNEIYLSSGSNSLHLGGSPSFVSLEYNTNSYIKIDASSIVKSSIPMTAKVNGVPDVYVGCPIGTIVMWAGLTSPDGWLICDGRGIALESSYKENVKVKQKFEDYQKLVNVIKNKYGESGGTPTNGWVIDETLPGASYVLIPDLQQRFPLGAKDASLFNGYDSYGNKNEVNTSLGKKGGNSSATLGVGTMPSHSHSVTAYITGSNGYSKFGVIDDRDKTTTKTYSECVNSTGDGKAHPNMPPYLTINFIIKYK